MLPRLRARLGALAAAVTLAVTAVPAAAADEPTGTDVSKWQHYPGNAPIDWPAVRADGHSFVFVKATEGVSITNPYFTADWADARSAGLYRGAYHFARPDRTVGDAVAEAGHFARAVGAINQPGDLPPVLDLEDASVIRGPELAAWVQTFLTTVEAATGRKPIIYTGPNFWADSMEGSTAFTGYPLWIAHYTDAAAPRFAPWPRWTFWQHSDDGTVSGISTAADLNRFNGTAAELARLALVPALPTLSLSGPRTPVPYGSSVTVSGKLHRADGSAVGGTDVQLFRRRNGETSPQLLTTVRTAADGTYRHTFRPTTGLQLRARSAATATDTSADSPALSVRVAATVQAYWTDRTVRPGQKIQLRGTARPHPGGTVVTRQVWDGQRWKPMAKMQVDSDGRFAFPLRVWAGMPRAHRVVVTPAGYATATDVLPKLQIS